MRVLVFNSAQSKRVRCDDAWVRFTLLAVDRAVRSGDELVASVGMPSWELALWRAASLGAPVHVVCPIGCRDDECETKSLFARQFGLAPGQATWTFLRSRRATGRHKDTWAARDSLTWNLAELLVPVSIRPRGRWDTLLQAAATCRTPVDTTWQVPWYEPPPHLGWNELAFTRWPRGFDASGGAVIHFTRGCAGPWPEERPADFYQALAAGAEGDPRDALHTLHRILEQQSIRASGIRVRGGARAVCFTAMPLIQTSSMFRWRARYVRPSFEPYGVAISKTAAQRLGARPVEYDRGALRERLGGESVWRQGSGAHDSWLHEQEWRASGDVDLTMLGDHEAAVLVATEAEAAAIRAWCRFSVVWLEAAANSSLGATRQSAQASNTV